MATQVDLLTLFEKKLKGLKSLSKNQKDDVFRIGLNTFNERYSDNSEKVNDSLITRYLAELSSILFDESKPQEARKKYLEFVLKDIVKRLGG